MTDDNKRELADEMREVYSATIKALAAIVTVHQPDNMFDLDAIPRDPVMRQVMRIREQMDKLSALTRSHTP